MDYQNAAVDYSSLPHHVLFPPAISAMHESASTNFISREKNEPVTVARYAAIGSTNRVGRTEAVAAQTGMIERLRAADGEGASAETSLINKVASQRAALLVMKQAKADSSIETLMRLQILARRMNDLSPRVHPSQLALLESAIGSLEKSKAALAEIDALLGA